MTTVQQVYEVMQRLAPPELAEHWDNPGLLVDCGGAVRRVLVTLDITPEVVAEAAAKQCTVIVAHHPVIFDPLKRLCPADVPYQLVRAGISAICMHTNLDAAEGGVNDVLSDLFSIRQRTAFADGCGRRLRAHRVPPPGHLQPAAKADVPGCIVPAGAKGHLCHLYAHQSGCSRVRR